VPANDNPTYNEFTKGMVWRRHREHVLTLRPYCEADPAHTVARRKATQVHHMNYKFGRLPPALLLIACCQGCHERFHTPGDDWCVRGMERSKRSA